MSVLSLIPMFFVLALIVPVTLALSRAYRRARGKQHIDCPDTGAPATIAIDARHAMLVHALGEESIRVRSCSFWPERRNCDQACVR